MISENFLECSCLRKFPFITNTDIAAICDYCEVARIPSTRTNCFEMRFRESVSERDFILVCRKFADWYNEFHGLSGSDSIRCVPETNGSSGIKIVGGRNDRFGMNDGKYRDGELYKSLTYKIRTGTRRYSYGWIESKYSNHRDTTASETWEDSLRMYHEKLSDDPAIEAKATAWVTAYFGAPSWEKIEIVRLMSLLKGIGIICTKLLRREDISEPYLEIYKKNYRGFFGNFVKENRFGSLTKRYLLLNERCEKIIEKEESLTAAS